MVGSESGGGAKVVTRIRSRICMDLANGKLNLFYVITYKLITKSYLLVVWLPRFSCFVCRYTHTIQ